KIQSVWISTSRGSNMVKSMCSFGIVGLVSLVIACCINHYVFDGSFPAKDYVLRSFFNDQKEKAKNQIHQEDEMVGVSGPRAVQAAFRAVILGAPGSGKGTISARIVKNFDVCHISSGDKLRSHIANQTELGKEVKKYLDSGSLVPDETMIALISGEIKKVGDKNWLLDGFPRTVSQAEALHKIHPVSLVINVDVPDQVILDRLRNRWIHLPSGRVYNIGFNDPKVPGKDDVTGEPLTQRPDDRPEIVQARLNEYADKTKPVIDYYKKLSVLESFSGNTTDSMWPSIKKCVEKYAKSI
ncbi:hypothetical protein QAD02_019251, partial [Eretmocerus hayati]